MNAFAFVLLGILAGAVSGTFGIGGGIVLIPFFTLVFGLTQKAAQGTSLAVMLPPITLLAVLEYHRHGNVNLKIALFIALGFLIGSVIAAHYVQYLPNIFMRKAFAVILFCIALKMLLIE